MSTKTFIFTGRSGVGKGTQVAFLKTYLEKTFSGERVLSFSSGDGLREFIKGDGYSEKRARSIYDSGGLFPEFLAIYNWSNYFVKNIQGDEHLILDGTPRKLQEAVMLDTAFEFYGKKTVYVIYMHGSREWSTKLLLGRGRSDDTPENIARRLDWFEQDVAATIDYYRNHTKHVFVEINAEQTREGVHKEIIAKLKL